MISPRLFGAAIEVHRALGAGLLESAYEECLCEESKLRGILINFNVPILRDGIRRKVLGLEEQTVE
jgi:hypothetical protein